MIGGARRALLALALGGAALSAHGCTPKPVGQLILVVQTDLSLPKDIDAIRIEASTGGVPKYKNDFVALGSPDGQIHLPGTLGLLAPSNAGDPVTVVVSAFTGGVTGTVRIVREVVTTVPPGRVAVLQMRLSFLCEGSQFATEMGGEVASACKSGESCVAGTCQSSTLDSSTLPTYAGNDQLDKGGGCFDGVQCWSDPTVAAVDQSDCSLPPVSGVNIALQTEGQGICGPSGCFVTLDADDPEGWTVRKDGRIQLPTGVCTQIQSGQIVNVVTQPISPACNGKDLSLPTCGAWSGAPANPPPYTGPLALAGGQGRPVSMALLPDGTTNDVYWVNGGTAVPGGTPTSSSLKSIGPAGGTPVTLNMGSASQAPRTLINAGGSTLFWTDAPDTPGAGTIFRFTTAGSKITPFVTKLDSPEGIAFVSVTGVGSKLFWTDFHDGTVSTADPSGDGTATVLVTGQDNPSRIGADRGYVYWTNEGTLGMTDGSVARYHYTAGTGMPETLASAEPTPRALALDLDANQNAVSVYWARFAPAPNGAILRVSGGATPGTPVVVATGLGSPNGIAVDAGSLYWTNRDDGTVMKLAKSAPPGTAPTVLARGQHAPGTVAVDSQFVYWVNEGSSAAQSGAIIKLAK